MMGWLLVFIGGGLGSMARYGLSRWLNVAGPVWPWGTFAANILACVIVGGAMGWMAGRGPLHDNARLALVTGFCGGFSTFSTFSGEVLGMVQAGRVGMAAGYAMASVLACVGAAWVGYVVGR